MLTWGVPSGTLLFIETNPTTKRETMKQNFELGQFVNVWGKSKHPDPRQRSAFNNETCVVVGVAMRAKTEGGSHTSTLNFDYLVIRAEDVGDREAERFWIPESAIYRKPDEQPEQEPEKEYAEVSETKGEVLFIHATHGNHFYGEILHVTDDNIFIRGTSPGNQEMLLNKAGWKIFKEVTV